jgi:molecular chaperone GrpE
MSQEENKQNSEESINNDEETIEELVEEEANEVGNDLERAQAELDQLKDKYARVHADFDNIKKRLEREKYQALEYAQEKFAKDLIPVVDSLEMAIKATEAKETEETDAGELLAKVKEGVELTMKQFLDVLAKHGITPVSEEEPFDPNVHHAVQQVDSPDHETGEIVSTFQKGYKYKDRTLRDAMVSIAN